MRDVQLSKTDAARVKRVLQQPRPCLLCGGAPHYAGIFAPDRPEVWGGMSHKTRLLGYALCRARYALPDRTRHVEARIMAGLVGRGN